MGLIVIIKFKEIVMKKIYSLVITLISIGCLIAGGSLLAEKDSDREEKRRSVKDWETKKKRKKKDWEAMIERRKEAFMYVLKERLALDEKQARLLEKSMERVMKTRHKFSENKKENIKNVVSLMSESKLNDRRIKKEISDIQKNHERLALYAVDQLIQFHKVLSREQQQNLARIIKARPRLIMLNPESDPFGMKHKKHGKKKDRDKKRNHSKDDDE